VFIKLEKPNGHLRPLWNLCKGYVCECLRVYTTRGKEGSRLVGKVCNLCRGLETGISVVLTVMSSLD
jgi:hypothetical protein